MVFLKDTGLHLHSASDFQHVRKRFLPELTLTMSRYFLEKRHRSLEKGNCALFLQIHPEDSVLGLPHWYLHCSVNNNAVLLNDDCPSFPLLHLLCNYAFIIYYVRANYFKKNFDFQALEIWMLVGWNQADEKTLKTIAVFPAAGLASQNQESPTCRNPRPLDIHCPLNFTFFFPLTVLVQLNVQPQSVEMDQCCIYGNMLPKIEKKHKKGQPSMFYPAACHDFFTEALEGLTKYTASFT